MHPHAARPCHEPGHYLFFGGLFETVRSLSFPCDERGRVALDGLSERARNNYLFARTVVGRDYTVPVVVAA
jgi:hypothetical protein